MRTRTLAGLFFCGTVLVYCAFSPGSMGGMGYIDEELRTTRELLAAIGVIDASYGSHPIHWTRHGVVGLLFHAPFVAIAAVAFPHDARIESALAAFEPILLTAGTATLSLAWVTLRTGSARLGMLAALVAAFCTMLWPYAYIGLEALQAFAVLAAGFLALQLGDDRTWRRTWVFAAACAVAVAAKSTGVTLIPAVAFLIWRYFRTDGAATRADWARRCATVALIAATLALNSHIRAFFWGASGDVGNYMDAWMVDGVWPFLANALSLLGSANKGLIVYAPIALAALLLLARAWRADRLLTVFALLVLGGLVGGFSLTRSWADDTWGPRYIVASVAPLVVLLAVTLHSTDIGAPARWALAAASLFGLWVSFLGVAFYYGSLHRAAIGSSQSTLEALQSDPVWNHPRFNQMLLRTWGNRLSGATAPILWTPEHQWWFAPPPDAVAWKAVEVGQFAQPQPVLLRSLGPDQPTLGRRWLLHFGCLLAGIALLALSARAGDRRMPAQPRRPVG